MEIGDILLNDRAADFECHRVICCRREERRRGEQSHESLHLSAVFTQVVKDGYFWNFRKQR